VHRSRKPGAGEDESTKNKGLCGLSLFFLDEKIWVPPSEDRSHLVIERLDPRLEQQMSALAWPLHWLLPTEALAHDPIDWGFDKPGRNRLAIAPPLPMVRNEPAISLDTGAKLLNRFGKLLEFGIDVFKIVKQGINTLDLVEALIDVVIPQGPLEPLEFLLNLSAQRLIAVYQAFGILAKHCETYRYIEPIQDMLCLRVEISLEVTHSSFF
jgi:hypothetical protein